MSAPKIHLTDEMCDRAWDAYCEARDNGEDEPAKVMRAAIEAAFTDVPLTNYGIGLALQFFDLVICVKDNPKAPAAGVYRSDDPTEGFDSLGHTLEVQWGHKPRRHIRRVAVGQLDPPE